jgi:hypothetical protein
MDIFDLINSRMKGMKVKWLIQVTLFCFTVPPPPSKELPSFHSGLVISCLQFSKNLLNSYESACNNLQVFDSIYIMIFFLQYQLLPVPNLQFPRSQV